MDALAHDSLENIEDGEEERTRSALLHMLEDLQRDRELARAARKQWVDTVDAISDPLFVCDSESRVTRCNRAYATAAALPLAEILGRPYWESFPKGSQHLDPLADAGRDIDGPHGAIYNVRAYSVRSLAETSPLTLYIFADVTEKRHAERELRSLARFPAENPNPVMRVAEDGTVLYANAASAPLAGHFAAGIGERVDNACIGRCLATNNVERTEIEHGGRHFLVSFAPNRAERDVNVYAVDVTEQKVAEHAVRESQERLALATNSARIGVWDWDVVNNRLVWDPQMYAVYGIREQDFTGAFEAWKATVHPEDRAAGEAAVAAALEGRKDFDHQFRVIWANGEVHHVQGYAVVQRAQDGTPIRMIGVNWDITDRKAAELSLQASEEKFRVLFDSSADGLMLMNIEAQSVRFANATMERLLGYGPGELEGKTLDTLHPAESLAAVRASFESGAKGDVRSVMDMPVLRKDGSQLFTDLSGGLITLQGRQYLLGSFRDATDRRAVSANLRRMNRALHTLSAGNETLVRATDEQSLLQQMTRVLSDIGGYKVAFIVYVNGSEERIAEPKATAGIEMQLLRDVPIYWTDNERGQSAVGRALRLGTTQLQRQPGQTAAYARWADKFRTMGIHAIAALPLRVAKNQAPIGAICIASEDEDPFDPQELKLLEELADDLGYGIANLRASADRNAALDKLRASLEGTIAAVAATMESRDPYTAGHQRRVADLAAAIAREMGLASAQVEGIHFGALIHDLGKIQIPAELLAKPTRLSKLELELIRTHPQAGYDIIKHIDFPWPIAAMVHQHHERIDGSGYPQGLKGEQIALEARVLTVADVTEAMASHRPYRPGLGIVAALNEIEAKRGVWFDPAAVDACLRLFREKGYVFDGK